MFLNRHCGRLLKPRKSRSFSLLDTPWPQRTFPIRPVTQEIRPSLHEPVLWRWRMCIRCLPWGIRRRHVCFFLTDTTPPRLRHGQVCLGVWASMKAKASMDGWTSTPRASRATAETTPENSEASEGGTHMLREVLATEWMTVRSTFCSHQCDSMSMHQWSTSLESSEHDTAWCPCFCLALPDRCSVHLGMPWAHGLATVDTAPSSSTEQLFVSSLDSYLERGTISFLCASWHALHALEHTWCSVLVRC